MVFSFKTLIYLMARQNGEMWQLNFQSVSKIDEPIKVFGKKRINFVSGLGICLFSFVFDKETEMI